MTTRWWGATAWPSDDYRAPVCDDDDERVPIPVGEACYLCTETIEESDQGTTIGGVVMNDRQEVTELSSMHAHIECTLRTTLGCYGQLIGQGHTHDVPYREDARKVRAWVQRGGLRE